MSTQSPSTPPIFPNLGHAVFLSIGLLMVQVSGGGLIGGIGIALGGGVGDSLNPWSLGLVNVVAAGVVLAIGFGFTRESPARFFGLQPFDRRLLPAIVMTSVGLAVVLSATVDLILKAISLLPGFKSPGDLLKWRAFPLGTCLFTVLGAPLTEEYVFRGMILRGLLAHHRPAIAIGFTALLFGIVHANPAQFVLGTVLGAVLGWWYVQTRSVAPALIGHAVFNAVGCTALLVPAVARFGFSYPGEPIVFQPWWLTLGGLLLTGTGLRWFRHLSGPLPAPTAPAPVPEPPLIIAEPPLLAAQPADQPPASPAS